jgi:hypothetical protein
LVLRVSKKGAGTLYARKMATEDGRGGPPHVQDGAGGERSTVGATPMLRAECCGRRAAGVLQAPQWRGAGGRRAAFWAALAGAAVLSGLLRIPFLSVPLTGDEAGYAYVAHWMARGQALYRDVWFDRPQGIFLLFGAITGVIGPSVEAIRAAAGGYNAATVVLVGLLGHRLFGRAAGGAAALAYAAASAAPTIEGFTANGELFMNLPAVAAVALAHAGRALGAGALLAVAAAIKPTAIPTAAPAIAVLVLVPCERSGRPARRAAALARAGIGALAVAAPFAVHGAIEAGAAAYWYAVAGFRLEAHSVFAAGGRFLDELRQTGPHVLFGLLPLWLLAAGWALWAYRRGRLRSRAGAAVVAYAGGACAGAALGGYWYWHYFVGVAPALALAAGAALRALPYHLRRAGGGGSAGNAGFAALLPAVAAAAAAAALAYNWSFVGATPDETSWRLYRSPGYLANREVAAYLRARTEPGDTVYAAFAQPDVYYLSGRRSAGKHLYWTEINRVPGALEAVVGALEDPRRCPKYVVRVQSQLEVPERAARFWERVDRRFVAEAAIGGLVLYRRVGD